MRRLPPAAPACVGLLVILGASACPMAGTTGSSWAFLTMGGLLSLGLAYAVGRFVRQAAPAPTPPRPEAPASDEHARFAVAAAGVGTWDWDIRTGEIHWSDTMKKLFGIQQELPVEAFLEWLHPEIREKVRAAVSEALERRTEYDTEYRLMRPDGTMRWIAARGRGFYDASGTAVRMQGVVQDVTSRKRADEQLRRLNDELREQTRRALEATRFKSEFLASMAHELRTPLNAIIGFSELLQDGKVGPVSDEQRACLGDVLSSGRHLLQLINDLLDLAKVEAGRLEFHPVPVDPARIAGEVRDALRALAARKRISVAVEVDPGLGTVVADPVKLKQVLYNYVSNALKSTPEEGSVEIRARPFGGRVLPIGGPGQRPRNPPRGPGAPLPRVPAARNVAAAETGRNRPRARPHEAPVEAQGGKVGAESSAGGSLLYAVLPRVAGGVSRTRPPAAATSDGPCALVVEDDAEERARLVKVLSEAGYAVQTAATGYEALGLCRKGGFDAVTLDVILPDMSGWDLLRGIREEGICEGARVVVVSLLDQRELGQGLGVDRFFVKPVDAGELLRALSHPVPPPCPLARRGVGRGGPAKANPRRAW